MTEDDLKAELLAVLLRYAEELHPPQLAGAMGEALAAVLDDIMDNQPEVLSAVLKGKTK